MPEVGGIAGDRLKSLIERIERLEQGKKDLGDDIKEVFAEAKGSGFDPKIMRQIIKMRNKDPDDLSEEEMLLDLYMRALGMKAYQAQQKQEDHPDEPGLPLGQAAMHRAGLREEEPAEAAMA